LAASSLGTRWQEESVINYRELELAERQKVNDFYQLTTYKRPVSPADRVFVAEDEGTFYGAVRVERNQDSQVLRGMYMHPEHIGKGMGSALLKAIEPVLAETNSYCIPLDHLFSFYGKAGFCRIETNDAPEFLRDRLESYFQEGKSVAIMYRSAG
jgi:N-acetylglutamate synthase-like GNAT family acetyltransferase